MDAVLVHFSFVVRVLLELEGEHERIQRAEQVFERRYLNKLAPIERVKTEAEKDAGSRIRTIL